MANRMSLHALPSVTSRQTVHETKIPYLYGNYDQNGVYVIRVVVFIAIVVRQRHDRTYSGQTP